MTRAEYVARLIKRERCPSATRHDEDATGHCRWCGRRTGTPAPRPSVNVLPRSNLTEAYEYHYDDDWGGRRDDR